MLTPEEASYLDVLSDGISRRVADPALLGEDGAPRWDTIDSLTGAGLIRQTVKANGEKRALWVNITSKGGFAREAHK